MRRLGLLVVLALGLVGAGTGTAQAQISDIDVAVTSGTWLDAAHVRVEGTVTCDVSAVFGDFGVRLRQRGGSAGFREGGGSMSLSSCGPTPTSFSLVVTGGPFHRGRAIYDASAFACDGIACVFDSSFGIVRIR
jgi:hypothetical protein